MGIALILWSIVGFFAYICVVFDPLIGHISLKTGLVVSLICGPVAITIFILFGVIPEIIRMSVLWLDERW